MSELSRYTGREHVKSIFQYPSRRLHSPSATPSLSQQRVSDDERCVTKAINLSHCKTTHVVVRVPLCLPFSVLRCTCSVVFAVQRVTLYVFRCVCRSACYVVRVPLCLPFSVLRCTCSVVFAVQRVTLYVFRHTCSVQCVPF